MLVLERPGGLVNDVLEALGRWCFAGLSLPLPLPLHTVRTVNSGRPSVLERERNEFVLRRGEEVLGW